MNREDILRALASDSVKQQAGAALLLMEKGSEFYEQVSPLLAASKKIDLNVENQSREEEWLVGYGVQAMAHIINAVGYDESISLHREILDWALELTSNRHALMRANAIWALGHLGTPPEETRNRLVEIVNSELWDNEHPHVTGRSMAFRMLARIDEPTAECFINTAACDEFFHAIEYWYPDPKQRHAKEVVLEAAWIHKARNKQRP